MGCVGLAGGLIERLGVAVASGLCFAAMGTDTGGSIRFPSAANGITGLKPTWGRVSRYGVFALSEPLDCMGPLVRSVADAAIVLSAIAGADPLDPTASHEARAGLCRNFRRRDQWPADRYRLGITDRGRCLYGTSNRGGPGVFASLAPASSRSGWTA